MTVHINDKNWLENQYINLKKSSIQIAKEQNVSKPTILRRLEKYNIPKRTLSEARLKKEPWNKGKKVPQISGKKHWNWKGNDVKYAQLHAKIRKNKPKSLQCEKCGKEGKLQLSFDHSLGEHTRNPEDYEWLCSKCHMRRDGIDIAFIEGGKSTRFKKGHIPWSKGKTNVYSEEMLKVMSEVQKGKKYSKETKERMSLSQQKRRKRERGVP